MKKQQWKKIMWKVAGIIVRSITYLALAIILVLPCAVELEKMGIIIYSSCLAWLGLMGALYLLEKYFGI